MSKAGIIAAVAATGVVATAVPTTLLTNRSGNSSKSKLKKPYIPKLTSASDIKKEYEKVECLKNYFGEIKFDGSKTSKPDNNSKFSSDSQSCLIVEYYKQTYTNNKWKGEFRLIWALRDNEQGLITVTNAKTRDDKWLWGNSAAYTLTKDNSGNAWTAIHAKEIKETKKDSKGLRNLIPQTTLTTSETLSTTNYWGFNPNLSAVCNADNCTETKKPEIRNSYYWEFTNGHENTTVSSWATDISHWFTQIFGWNGFENKMNEVKGKWE